MSSPMACWSAAVNWPPSGLDTTTRSGMAVLGELGLLLGDER